MENREGEGVSNKKWCLPNYPCVAEVRKSQPDRYRKASMMSILGDVSSGLNENGHSLGEQEWAHCKRSVSIELWLATRNSPSVFIQSQDLVRFLFESSYSRDLFYEASILFPFSWVVFPTTSIGGINLRPCAFGRVGGKHIRDGYEYSFYIGLPRGIFAESIGEKDLGRLLDFDYLMNPRLDDLNGQTSASLKLHVRLCAAVAVYAAAFPDYIRDGLPDDVKAPELHKPRILRAAPQILEGATRTSVSMHIRAGHFRCLRDERYKRNDDGTAKIVFVRQSIVAGKLTPKTAEGL